MNTHIAERTRAAKASRLMRSLIVYARMLGQAWNVTVVFDPTVKTANCNGSVIRLCPLDIGTDEDAVLVDGLIDHEAGVHCRQTDFALVDSLLEGQPKILHTLWNIIEDVWGERELYKVKPGCARSIRQALEIMVSRAVFKGPQAGAHPAAGVVNMLVCGLRSAKLGQGSVADLYLLHRQQLEDQVGPELVDLIWATAQEVDAVRSSAQAVALAKKLLDLIKAAADNATSSGNGQPDPSQPPQQSNGTGNGQPDPSQPPQQSNGTGNGQPDPSQPPQQSNNTGNGQPDPSQPPQQSNNTGQTPSPSVGQPTPQQSANIKRIVEATPEESGSGELADSIVSAMSSQSTPTRGGSYGAGNTWDLTQREAVRNPAVDAEVAQLARPVALRLGSKLDQVLMIQSTSDTYHAVRGRRLAGNLLPKVVSSSYRRVFRRTDDVQALDTAVMVLTDVSASMRSSLDDDVKCIGAASAATRALGDTLDRFDIPFAIRYFGQNLTRVKSFEKRWRTVRDLHYSALESSTCTHLALYSVLPEIAVRDEARKVLVLLTDGIPSDTARTLAALNEAIRAQINVAVFLVGSTASLSVPGVQAFMAALAESGIPHARASTSTDIANRVFEAVRAATR